MSGQTHAVTAAAGQDSAKACVLIFLHGGKVQILKDGAGPQKLENLVSGLEHGVVGPKAFVIHTAHHDGALVFHIVASHAGPAHGHGQVSGHGHIACGTVTAIIEALVGHAPDHQGINVGRFGIGKSGDFILLVLLVPQLTHGVLTLGGRLGLNGTGHTQVNQLAGDPAHLDLVGIFNEAKIHRILGNVHIGADIQLVLQPVQNIHAGIVALNAYGQRLVA